MGVAATPMLITSRPAAVSPSWQAAASSGELSRPSKPRATRLPPLRFTSVPKVRPMARASAGWMVRPTMPRMSYSRSTVGSNLCAVSVMQCSSGSSARLRTASAFIGKAQAAHFLGIEDVAQIDDTGLAHQLLQAPRIEAAELGPFGDDHQHVRTGRGVVGGLGKGEARQQAGRFLHALGIEGHDPRP